jgi:hypothetical protein
VPRVEETLVRDHVQRLALANRHYGHRRIAALLRREGLAVNKKRTLRLMQEDNLLCLRRRAYVPATTDSRHAWRIWPNLAWQLEPMAPNQLWVADITYVRLVEEFGFLAVLLDAFSRRVIGWAMASHLRASLALGALEMALSHRAVPPAGGLVHHSDRGVQGGFKRSSQHPDGGGCDEHSKAAIGSVWPGAVAVTRSTAGGGTRGTEAVLGGDRCRVDKRGCCGRGRRVATSGNQMVPKGRRHATSDVQILGEAALWTLPLVCGAGGDCASSCAGPFHAGDRTPAQAVRFDHLP